MPRLRFAGQITGCEGYVESAAIGLLAGRFAAAERRGEPPLVPPPTTAHGALLGHITGGHIETIDAGPRSFQPMNVNFGLFPPLGGVARGVQENRRFACAHWPTSKHGSVLPCRGQPSEPERFNRRPSDQTDCGSSAGRSSGRA